MKLWWTWLGVVAAGAMAAGASAGCGDDGNSGVGGSGGTSSSTSASSGETTNSTSSGSMVGSGGSMAGSGGSTASSGGSTASSGGGQGYADCSACTSNTTGAYVKECKAETDACLADATCTAISQCAFSMCQTSQEGACCTLQCFKDNNASQASIDLFKAMDGCVYCETCKTKELCGDLVTDYCPVFQPGGESVCTP